MTAETLEEREVQRRFRVRCNAVRYRQGFIEVISQIHPGLVNMETWEINAAVDIAGLNLGEGAFTDDDFVANTELELTPAQARALAAALMNAADRTEGGT